MENNNMNQVAQPVQKSGKSRRGFASMDKERHKLVSSKGGKAIRTHYTPRNTSPAAVSTSTPLG
ncbi:MAG TPA: hypothetical protein VF145_04170 [Chitinophagaceae bacterium]